MLTFRIIPVYYKEVLHLPEAWIGLILGLNGIIIAFFEMVIVSRLEGRKNPVIYIRWGLWLGSITFLSLFLPGPALFIAIVSIVFFTFSEIFAMPFMNTFWIGRSSDSNRGSYAAVYTIAWSVAQILGPYLGALVVDHYSYSVLWIAAMILCTFCGVFLFTLKENKTTAYLEAT
jgi:predicted MFS family arabinose efflux permease